MGDIRGVHRTVSYRATFHERDGQTHWQAKFHHDGRASEACGSIFNDLSQSWDPIVSVREAAQRYIETTLLRAIDELDQRSGRAK